MAAADNVTPGWYSLRGAAIYTGFHESSIRTAMEAGRFPVFHPEVSPGSRKSSPRIKREDLDAWIEGRPIISAPRIDAVPSTGLLNATDMGRALGGISRQNVVNWYHQGIIPAVVAEDRLYRFDREDVRRVLAERAALNVAGSRPATASA